jgi:hypothetical protein
MDVKLLDWLMSVIVVAGFVGASAEPAHALAHRTQPPNERATRNHRAPIGTFWHTPEAPGVRAVPNSLVQRARRLRRRAL